MLSRSLVGEGVDGFEAARVSLLPKAMAVNLHMWIKTSKNKVNDALN